MRRLKLLGQRTLVAVLGLVTVWLILVLFYDVADRRLPLVLALASTYAAAAYLILPRAIRLGVHILADSDGSRPPIPTRSRPAFRFDVGHHSEMKPATR